MYCCSGRSLLHIRDIHRKLGQAFVHSLPHTFPEYIQASLFFIKGLPCFPGTQELSDIVLRAAPFKLIGHSALCIFFGSVVPRDGAAAGLIIDMREDHAANWELLLNLPVPCIDHLQHVFIRQLIDIHCVSLRQD